MAARTEALEVAIADNPPVARVEASAAESDRALLARTFSASLSKSRGTYPPTDSMLTALLTKAEGRMSERLLELGGPPPKLTDEVVIDPFKRHSTGPARLSDALAAQCTIARSRHICTFSSLCSGRIGVVVYVCVGGNWGVCVCVCGGGGGICTNLTTYREDLPHQKRLRGTGMQGSQLHRRKTAPLATGLH
jgi:hypothetical protein